MFGVFQRDRDLPTRILEGVRVARTGLHSVGRVETQGAATGGGREISLIQRADSSRGHGGVALEGKIRIPYRNWFISLLICMLLVAVAFTYFDVPIARLVYGIFAPAESVAKGLSSAVLLGIEAVVALDLVFVRIMRGHLSPFREATVLACLTSICAYAINDSTLKFIFGVPNPDAVLHGTRHAVNLLRGAAGSSFPSGHMVLAGAFAGVFMRLFRISILPLSALLLLAAAMLIAGEWHFVSDVIAGTFLGVSAGCLAGEVWLAHSR